MRHPYALRHWALLLLLALMWGSSFLLMKRGLEVFDPVQVGGLRMVMAAAVMAPWAIVLMTRKGLRVPPRSWKHLLAIGVFGNALPALLFPLAERGINSATAGILNALTPMFALLIGAVFFAVRLTPMRVVGVVVAFGGAVLLTAAGRHPVSLASSAAYALAAVAATVCYGISVNVNRRYLTHLHPVLITAVAFGLGCLPYAVALAYSLPATAAAHPPAALWGAVGNLAVLAVVNSALATVLFTVLVQQTDVIFSSSVTYLIPIFALGWGLADGEALAAWQYLGMAVILLGVWWGNR